MLPPCSSSLVSPSHSYDETITNRHPRNDAAACVRYVEPELTAEVHRHLKMAAANTEDLQCAFAVCCIRCPCPYLHAWVVFDRL